MSISKSTTAGRIGRDEIIWQRGLQAVALGLILIVWEWYGRTRGGLLIAPFSEVAAAFVKLLGTREFYRALWVSNQALFLGYGVAVLIGVPLGLLIGMQRSGERFVDVYLNVLIVTPMAAIIPVIIVLVGLNLAARVLVIVLFAFPVITVNSRAGLKRLNPSLLDMVHVFGGTQRDQWLNVLLPGALPGILAGLRVGLGRALSGMVAVELLLVSVGYGQLLLRASGMFKADVVLALTVAVMIEAVLLMTIARRIEIRLTPWHPRPQS